MPIETWKTRETDTTPKGQRSQRALAVSHGEERVLQHARVGEPLTKSAPVNQQGEHLSYDFDRCVQLCERMGFKGIYLVEQWSRKDQDFDAEKIADWMLQRLRMNI